MELVFLMLFIVLSTLDDYIKSWTRHRVMREIVRAAAAQGQPLDRAFIRRVMNDNWDEEVDNNEPDSPRQAPVDWRPFCRAWGVVIISTGVGLALAALLAAQSWPAVLYPGWAASILVVCFGSGLLIASRGKPGECSTPAAEHFCGDVSQ